MLARVVAWCGHTVSSAAQAQPCRGARRLAGYTAMPQNTGRLCGTQLYRCEASVRVRTLSHGVPQRARSNVAAQAAAPKKLDAEAPAVPARGPDLQPRVSSAQQNSSVRHRLCASPRTGWAGRICGGARSRCIDGSAAGTCDAYCASICCVVRIPHLDAACTLQTDALGESTSGDLKCEERLLRRPALGALNLKSTDDIVRVSAQDVSSTVSVRRVPALVSPLACAAKRF